MPRFATIDIGTNSVLLLVAEQDASGCFQPVVERAQITRLGRGVDKTRHLAPEAMGDTLQVLESFVREARDLGVQQFAVCATSAARDAANGAEFLDGAGRRCGVEVEIISGDLEAQLAYLAARSDFGSTQIPLVVIDIGGGSTEFIYGSPPPRTDKVGWHRSFDLGSVRLTERLVKEDPLTDEDRARLAAHLQATFVALPAPPSPAQLVGIAGTVTTLYTVQHAISPYDPPRVHGQVLTLNEVRELARRLGELPLDERRRLPGLEPNRADVIPAGAHILAAAMEQLGADTCTVSDRGIRWGLMLHRFGG